jgi:His-Xaa-Ser system radical SAM maturase HxsC
MRQLKCQTTGLKERLLGRVTLGGVPEEQQRDHILVTGSTAGKGTRGYKAVVTDRDAPTRKSWFGGRPRIARVDCELSAFHEGDILQIEPGADSMTFVYENGSRDNALLVTERCNCRCLTCPQPPKVREESRTGFNRELIRLMAPGPESLAITGGEPTLLGDELLTLISDCKRWLADTNLIILSNGRRFRDREFVEGIARLGHPRLTVAVALYGDVDTLHDEIVAVKGAFDETVRGACVLALYVIPVEIRVVVSALNYRRLPQIVDFIYANMPFACHVALMGLETVGLAVENLDRVWVDPFDYRDELHRACRYLSRRMIPVSVYNLPLCIVPEDLWPVAKQSISGWKNIYHAECDGCRVKDNCCGFFASSDVRRSSHVAPVVA